MPQIPQHNQKASDHFNIGSTQVIPGSSPARTSGEIEVQMVALSNTIGQFSKLVESVQTTFSSVMRIEPEPEDPERPEAVIIPKAPMAEKLYHLTAAMTEQNDKLASLINASEL